MKTKKVSINVQFSIYSCGLYIIIRVILEQVCKVDSLGRNICRDKLETCSMGIQIETISKKVYSI